MLQLKHVHALLGPIKTNTATVENLDNISLAPLPHPWKVVGGGHGGLTTKGTYLEV